MVVVYSGPAVHMFLVYTIHLSCCNFKCCMFSINTEKFHSFKWLSKLHSKFKMPMQWCGGHGTLMSLSFHPFYRDDAYEAIHVATNRGVNLAGGDWGGLSVSDFRGSCEHKCLDTNRGIYCIFWHIRCTPILVDKFWKKFKNFSLIFTVLLTISYFEASYLLLFK